eukprot:1151686-Pelagomonas_calceolata.AAC.2
MEAEHFICLPRLDCVWVTPNQVGPEANTSSLRSVPAAQKHIRLLTFFGRTVQTVRGCRLSGVTQAADRAEMMCASHFVNP